MQRIATYHSILEAQQDASFLLDAGVPTRVITLPGDTATINQLMGRGTHELHAADKPSADHAKRLLEERGQAEPVAIDPGWEDQYQPDLTRLPAGLTVPCTACGHDLRSQLVSAHGRPALHAIEGTCPACSRSYDAVECVLRAHGPEALQGCYPEDSAEGMGIAAGPGASSGIGAGGHTRASARISVPCLRCGYALDGPASRGHCPECGLRYDKPAQLRGLMGS